MMVNRGSSSLPNNDHLTTLIEPKIVYTYIRYYLLGPLVYLQTKSESKVKYKHVEGTGTIRDKV